MSTCAHWKQFQFKAPSSNSHVYREECTQCFTSQVCGLNDNCHDEGIWICLSCFNGGCLSHARQHSRLSRHVVTLHLQRHLKPQSEERPLKMTKLQVREESEQDLYDYKATIECLGCPNLTTVQVDPTQLSTISQAILMATSAQQKSEMKAWQEAEVLPCEHTLCLEQVPQAKMQSHCHDCNLKENLWLCLVCGNLGCGRKQYDGSGGNNHGIQHFEATGHPVSCKLGTITAEGAAGLFLVGQIVYGRRHLDIYCYACDDMKQDPELGAHLAVFGVNIASQQKTAKSMAELELEQNLKFDFSMVTEDGKSLEPVYGPGLTGMKNIGNSCYLASVVQSLHSLPAFSSRYIGTDHVNTCASTAPAGCYLCQMGKLTNGLLSGDYSRPAPVPAGVDISNSEVFQKGIPPTMFKTLIGQGHPEFSTMRQQDAFEFLEHLLKTMEQKERPLNMTPSPSSLFDFVMTQRLQCTQCHKVRLTDVKHSSLQVRVPANRKGTDDKGEPTYEPVSLEQCLDTLLQEEEIEGFRCPGCNHEPVIAKSSSRFKTFPQVLVLHAQRFVLENWVPKKLNVPVKISKQQMDLSMFKSVWPLSDDEFLPAETQAAATSAEPQVNSADLEQLMSMGFSRNRCIRALVATNGAGVEAAMEWLFSKMDDVSLDDPFEMAATNEIAEVPQEMVQMLMDMGFTSKQAQKALRETEMNTERAVEWLFSHPDETGEDDQQPALASRTTDPGPSGSTQSPYCRLQAVIAHKGTSVHCGHYVAYVYRPEESRWILFNDEKVVVQPNGIESEGIQQGYIYILANAD